jgi:hypothetical protein
MSIDETVANFSYVQTISRLVQTDLSKSTLDTDKLRTSISANWMLATPTLLVFAIMAMLQELECVIIRGFESL